jgi:acetoacetyl-CoA synthetase
VPIKRLLQGNATAEIINGDAMLNPDSLDWFIAFHARRIEQRSAEFALTTTSEGARGR